MLDTISIGQILLVIFVILMWMFSGYFKQNGDLAGWFVGTICTVFLIIQLIIVSF